MEFIAEALSSIGESERELVALLYGFGGPRRTVEQIAKQYRLSVVQVEKKAKSVMRRVRHPACARHIRGALIANDERIWSSLGGAAGILYKLSSLPEAGARMPGELLFAIECQYGSLENWLNDHTRQTGRAWYRSPFPEDELERLMQDLAADTLPLPLPLETLAARFECEARALETAVHLSGRRRLYAGCVASTPLGTRAPRALRLHNILTVKHAGEVVPTRQLVSEYRQTFADDACNLLDGRESMAAYPHLFLRSFDLGWSSIGTLANQGPALDGSDDVGFHRWSEDRRSERNAADYSSIRGILEERGPLRIHQIESLVKPHSSAGIPDGGIAGYLSNSEDFVRIAPGIYSLAAAEVPATSKLLLNVSSCLKFVQALHAGEPADIYPMWTTAMEAEWCEWAQVRAKHLLGPLLSVVEPSRWSAPDSYKDIWLWKKDCVSFYGLEEEPAYPLADVPLLDLLSLVRCARWRGAMNWVLANRATGQGLLNGGSASAMALLIGVGALVPAKHWQRPHSAAPGGGEIDGMLSAELHRQGFLAWDGPSGRILLDKFAKTIDSGRASWAPAAEQRKLLDLLTPKLVLGNPRAKRCVGESAACRSEFIFSDF